NRSVDPGQDPDVTRRTGSSTTCSPDDTASNLDPGNSRALGFPQFGHGSIKLTVLFNNPHDIE
ncbi:MAG TPA: hypothetical protein VGA40_01935, partial [Candidatus Acidoferrales bacterium]